MLVFSSSMNYNSFFLAMLTYFAAGILSGIALPQPQPPCAGPDAECYHDFPCCSIFFGIVYCVCVSLVFILIFALPLLGEVLIPCIIPPGKNSSICPVIAYDNPNPVRSSCFKFNISIHINLIVFNSNSNLDRSERIAVLDVHRDLLKHNIYFVFVTIKKFMFEKSILLVIHS